MKILTKISPLFLFVYIYCSAQSNWSTQSISTTVNLKSVVFYNADNGWIIGDSGAVFHTTDGGNLWQRQFPETDLNLHSMVLLDANNCIAVGDSGVVLKTTDGGVNWNMQNYIPKYTLRSISFVDSSEGWICGGGYQEAGAGLWSGVILHTTDGGITWNSQVSNSYGFFDIQFLNNLTGYAIGFSTALPIFYYTSNGGTTWQTDSFNVLVFPSYSMHFINSDQGFLTWNNSNFGGLISTADAGTSWSSPSVFFPHEIRKIKFLNTSKGYLCGLQGMMYYTTDGGSNWIPDVVGTTEDLNGLFFVNDSTGWIVGSNGKVFHTTSDLAGVFDRGGAAKFRYELYQNYPNPFNPSTAITFRIAQQSFVSLEIFDVLGREVTELVLEEMSSGEYTKSWNAGAFPSGVYFYRLRAGNYAETKKLLLLK